MRSIGLADNRGAHFHAPVLSGYLWVPIAGLLAIAVWETAAAQTAPQFAQWRRQLVDTVIVSKGVKNADVLQSMRTTPRHEFVPTDQQPLAYFDMSLTIGKGQTMSSPSIVAYMTEQMNPQPTDRVLEIGTGSGYQAAVLSPLVKQVYTIEIIKPLGRRAERTLRRLGYSNVFVRIGDGFQGWSEHAPFDKIIVTCSPEKVPQPLADQLREGGLMIIPVGDTYHQTLYLMRKKDGKLVSEKLQTTLFVPMTGRAFQDRQAPDAEDRPGVVNGNFEAPPVADRYSPGWFYQQQVTWESADSAPEGRHYITIRNQTPGRMAHIMQGFAADGRQVTAIRASAWVKYKDTKRGLARTEVPAAAVTFYDENRHVVGGAFLGVFLGSGPWQKLTKEIDVPTQSRHAIILLGQFGSTGELSFDDIHISPIAQR